MSTASPTRATLDDLLKEPGKAELIGGRIVRYMATGYLPSRVASRIFRSLDDYCDQKRSGHAFNDNLGFAIPEITSGRQSFSPDASYYEGALPANLMRFIEGPPNLAVEVRSENDYTAAAEREILAKRLDYFEAGTQVVWDVDPVAGSIAVYRSTRPDVPVIYLRGQIAEAEPAVPGWRVDVDWIFG